MATHRAVERPSNTTLIAVWTGQAAGERRDLLNRLVRLPRLTYAVRTYEVPGALVAVVTKAREFSPREAARIAWLLSADKVPKTWDFSSRAPLPADAAAVNPCPGRVRAVNPSPKWIPVKIMIPLRHTDDPEGWARAHGFGEPWTVNADAGEWAIWLIDPSVEVSKPRWRTLSGPKRIRALFAFVEDPEDDPRGAPGTDFDPATFGDGAEVQNPTIDPSSDRVEVLRRIAAACDALAMRVRSLASVSVGTGDAVFLPQVQHDAADLVAALTREFLTIRNPETPEDVARAVDSFVSFHWGHAPDSMERIPAHTLRPSGALVAIGYLAEVVYRTKKRGARATLWRHEFGEETGEGDQPILAHDARGALFIIGGSYSIDRRGIIN